MRKATAYDSNDAVLMAEVLQAINYRVFVDVRTLYMRGTIHCILTAVVLLSKDNST